MKELQQTILQAIAHASEEDKAAIREAMFNTDAQAYGLAKTHSFSRDLLDGLEEMLDIRNEEIA